MKRNKDLRDFLAGIREKGSDFYVEVKKPLEPELEVCVIQQKLAKAGRYPVIYCPEIKGSKLPLITNVFGSYEMLGLALGIAPEEQDKSKVLHEFRKRVANKMPIQFIPAKEAPVKEIVLTGKDVDLGLLPITRHALLDSGKYVTIGCMICKDPDTGTPNVGIYRHEVKGKDELGCMVNPAHHASYIARRYAELGKPTEVVLFVGHHPAVILGADIRGDMDDDEMEIMGGLLGEPLLVTKGETVDVPVPAWAEVAIEGVIDPTKMVTDGPFAEYSGYYGEAEKPSFLIKVTSITMRKDAIYHDLDPAHREHNFSSGLPFESNAYDIIKKIVPSLKAIHFPPSGTCILHMYVSIKKRIAGEGKMAGLAAIASDLSVKLVIVVDEDIDIYNEEEVLWAVATRVVGDKDISIIPSVAGAHLDPSAYDETRLKSGNMTSNVIIDATKPTEMPFATRITPPPDLWKSMRLEDYI